MSLNTNSIRYIDDFFNEVIITKDKDIYGEADEIADRISVRDFNPLLPFFLPTDSLNVDDRAFAEYKNEIDGKRRQLFFDFYEPEGDSLELRPLIIMAFGGAFIGGSKNFQKELKDFCLAMSKKGFCVANIDYRLGFDLAQKDTIVRAVYRGCQDFKAAVRYFREKAASYKINPDYIFGGGHSAGAINAIHAAFVNEEDRTPTSIFSPTYKQQGWPDLNDLNSSGNTSPGNGKPNAVINLWGATASLEWITKEIPVISFYGQNDKIVNPESGAPFDLGKMILSEEFPIHLPNILFPELYGSIAINKRLKELGGRCELHPIDVDSSDLFIKEFKNHEVWLENPDNAKYIQEKTARFLHSLMND